MPKRPRSGDSTMTGASKWSLGRFARIGTGRKSPPDATQSSGSAAVADTRTAQRSSKNVGSYFPASSYDSGAQKPTRSPTDRLDLELTRSSSSHALSAPGWSRARVAEEAAMETFVDARMMYMGSTDIYTPPLTDHDPQHLSLTYDTTGQHVAPHHRSYHYGNAHEGGRDAQCFYQDNDKPPADEQQYQYYHHGGNAASYAQPDAFSSASSESAMAAGDGRSSTPFDDMQNSRQRASLPMSVSSGSLEELGDPYISSATMTSKAIKREEASKLTPHKSDDARLSPIFQSRPRHALHEFEPLVTLGTGTFGRVLLVRRATMSRSDPHEYYALKVLSKPDVVRLKQVTHTNNERNILSRVHHPFVVNLHCTYQDQRNCYMLMEYVVGGEVFSHLRKARRFSVDVTRFYIASLVLALAYLHSEKVLYRDLKPENLLLDRHGYIKIADFGFAKSLELQERTWTLCGTPEYLSPEVIQSQGQSFASDYWALGVLMYEMLCGFPPFYDSTPFATYEKILQCQVNFPKHVDALSRDLILALLTKDVSRRLGNLNGGALDVMRHPWFNGVDWEELKAKRIPAPIVPVLSHAGDSTNFQKYDDFDIASMPALHRSALGSSSTASSQDDVYHTLFRDF